MSTSPLQVLYVHAAIALTVIVGALVLLALHDLDTATGIALVGVGVTLVGGSASGLIAAGSVQRAGDPAAAAASEPSPGPAAAAPPTVPVTSQNAGNVIVTPAPDLHA